MDERMARAQLVSIEIDRLTLEGRGCTDPERLNALSAELNVLLESLREIRREQLREHIAGARTDSWQRRWLQRRRRDSA